MKVCNAQAGQDKLTSDGRKAYLSTCLKKSTAEALMRVPRSISSAQRLRPFCCAAVPSAFTGALADSGGYRRPAISAPSGSVWSAPSADHVLERRLSAPVNRWQRLRVRFGRRCFDLAGRRRAGATAVSCRAADPPSVRRQPRRVPTQPGVPAATWSRRPPSYAAPAGFGGGYGTAAFWAMLGALSASDRAAYFRQSQVDPAYQQWRQQAIHDPNASARLAALGDHATAATSDAGATAALASGGSGIVWLVLFVAVAVFALLWLARRRAARPPAIGVPPGLSGSGATRFRVGQAIPLDPAPFLLAAGVTKVQPPPAGGMISVEAVGLLEDADVRLHRLYLPGRTAFFQLHLGDDGVPDECRYFSRLDEVRPASQAEWGEWLDPGQGMIGWPAFQTKDGKTYDRAWAPGQSQDPAASADRDRTGPRRGDAAPAAGDAVCRSDRRRAARAAKRVRAWSQPSRTSGQAWVEIHAGIDVNPASLTLPPVPL